MTDHSSLQSPETAGRDKNNSVYTNWLYGQEKKDITIYIYVSPVFSFLLRFPLVLTSSSSHLLCLRNTFIIDPSLYICPCSWIVLIIPVKPAIIIFVITNSSHVRES
jgi:hypothetical protein